MDSLENITSPPIELIAPSLSPQEEGATLLAEATPPPKEEGNPLLTLDPGVAIWSLAVFGLLLLLLTRFVWKPLLAGIDARENKLRSAVEQAEQTRIASERTQQLRQKMLDDAKQQASDVVAQARITAESLAGNMKQEAQNERIAILESSQHSIDSMLLTAQQKLRMQAIETTVELTGKLLRQKLDDDASKRIVKEMIQELEREQRG